MRKNRTYVLSCTDHTETRPTPSCANAKRLRKPEPMGFRNPGSGFMCYNDERIPTPDTSVNASKQTSATTTTTQPQPAAFVLPPCARSSSAFALFSSNASSSQLPSFARTFAHMTQVLIVNLQNGHERLLRAPPRCRWTSCASCPAFCFSKQLALAADVAAVAFRKHVFALGLHRLDAPARVRR